MSEENGKQVRPHRVPKDWRTPPANPGSLVLMLLGILFACVGVAVAAGAELIEGLEPYLASAARYGVEAGTFFVGGVVLVGLGMVSRYHRSSSKRILQNGPETEAFEDVFTELAGILEHVKGLQAEQTHVRHEIGNVKHQISKQREEAKTGDSKDALFRLAASLDQLGARLDQRIGKASSEVHEGLYELTTIVESSRDFIQDNLERTSRDVRDAADRASRASVPVQPVYMPHPGMYPQAPVPPQQPPAEGGEYEVPSQDPDFDSNNYEVYEEEEEYSTNAEDELRILVELEEEAEEEEEEPAASGLGLLDELDDYGEPTHPEPTEAPTSESEGPTEEPAAATLEEAAAPAAESGTPPADSQSTDIKLAQPTPPLPSATAPIAPPRPLGTLDEGMRGRLDQIKTLLEGEGIQYPQGPPEGGPPA
jgi:hypothetical protein